MNSSAAQSPSTAGDASDPRANVVLIAVPIQLALVTYAVALRLYARGVLMRRYGLEDALALISWLVVCVNGSLIMALTRVGLGHNIGTLPEPDGLKNYLEVFWFSILFYNVGLMTVNFAVLALYHRIMHVTQWRRRVEVVGLFAATCAMVQFGIIGACRPLAGFWDKSAPTGCHTDLLFMYISVAINILIHFVILVLPIPMIRQTQLSRAQKVFLLGILSLGFFTCVVSLLRIRFYRISDDPTYENVNSALCSLAELCSGLVCACLPVLRPPLGGARRRRSRRHRSGRLPGPPEEANPITIGNYCEKLNIVDLPGRATVNPAPAASVDDRGRAPLGPVLSRLNRRYEERDIEAAPPPALPHPDHVVRHIRRPDTTRNATGPSRLYGVMGLLSAPRLARDDSRATQPERYAAARETGLTLPYPEPTYFPTQAHYQLPHHWRSMRGARANTRR